MQYSQLDLVINLFPHKMNLRTQSPRRNSFEISIFSSAPVLARSIPAL
ncbi:hypothetical protein ACP4OV_029211 [Aristida adscensionis]